MEGPGYGKKGDEEGEEAGPGAKVGSGSGGRDRGLGLGDHCCLVFVENLLVRLID